jgi:hypothetical protein
MSRPVLPRTDLERLSPRARNLARDHYLPGRPILAAKLAMRIFRVVVARGAAIEGRATLLADAHRLFVIAGRDDRAEGCRMLCAAIMGVDLDASAPESRP